MGATKTPAAPDPNKSYQQGVDVYLKNLPALLNAEQDARAKYDDPSIEANLNRQETYGPRQINDDLARLQQIDPTGQAVREQLGHAVTTGSASGTGLPSDFRAQLSQFQGAAADARGGSVGSATPEDVFKGGDALAFYNARLGDTQKFLAGPTPEQQFQLIPQVAPDRGSAYVNMNAGTQGQQFALSNYNNQLAQSGQNLNWWARALKGASIGASEGGTFGGGWGALGGAAGGAFDGAINGPIYQYKTGTG